MALSHLIMMGDTYSVQRLRPRKRRRGPVSSCAAAVVTTLLMLVSVTAAAQSSSAAKPAPLPAKVLQQAPEIHPLGKGRHSWFGIHIYDATMWIVGDHWSPDQPHAIDLESGRDITPAMLVGAAIDEMRDLKIGDPADRQRWRAEMLKAIPSIRRNDRVVVFTASGATTVLYYNDSEVAEIDDPTFAPALFKVWLDPRSKNQQLRRSLLKDSTR
jgi:hypothetical protein